MFPYLDMSEKGMVMFFRDGHVFAQDLKTLGWCPVGSVLPHRKNEPLY